jgi:hypothetical protein
VPLYLPNGSCSVASTPLAGCPQYFGLAISLRFAQQLLVTLLPELEIHHLVHSPFAIPTCGWPDQALSLSLRSLHNPALNSVTTC